MPLSHEQNDKAYTRYIFSGINPPKKNKNTYSMSRGESDLIRLLLMRSLCILVFEKRVFRGLCKNIFYFHSSLLKMHFLIFLCNVYMRRRKTTSFLLLLCTICVCGNASFFKGFCFWSFYIHILVFKLSCIVLALFVSLAPLSSNRC